MRKTLLTALLAACALVAGPALAADAAGCEAKAVGKDGKPLAGAAKASFMKKCNKEAAGDVAKACEAKAVGSDGKTLAGAAKKSFVTKCVKEGGPK